MSTITKGYMGKIENLMKNPLMGKGIETHCMSMLIDNPAISESDFVTKVTGLCKAANLTPKLSTLHSYYMAHKAAVHASIARLANEGLLRQADKAKFAGIISNPYLGKGLQALAIQAMLQYPGITDADLYKLLCDKSGGQVAVSTATTYRNDLTKVLCQCWIRFAHVTVSKPIVAPAKTVKQIAKPENAPKVAVEAKPEVVEAKPEVTEVPVSVS